MKISLTKDLEMADVGHRVWTDVLRVKLETGKYVSKRILNREG